EVGEDGSPAVRGDMYRRIMPVQCNRWCECIYSLRPFTGRGLFIIPGSKDRIFTCGCTKVNIRSWDPTQYEEEAGQGSCEFRIFCRIARARSAEQFGWYIISIKGGVYFVSEGRYESEFCRP